MAEIVFILEPDTGRVTVESSNADSKIARAISKNLGQGIVINCARPNATNFAEFAAEEIQISHSEQVYLYRIYHHSTVDGSGRRSVIQLAGCSIRCAGCYVPETHLRENGKLISIAEIFSFDDLHGFYTRKFVGTKI